MQMVLLFSGTDLKVKVEHYGDDGEPDDEADEATVTLGKLLLQRALVL